MSHNNLGQHQCFPVVDTTASVEQFLSYYVSDTDILTYIVLYIQIYQETTAQINQSLRQRVIPKWRFHSFYNYYLINTRHFMHRTSVYRILKNFSNSEVFYFYILNLMMKMKFLKFLKSLEYLTYNLIKSLSISISVIVRACSKCSSFQKDTV